MTKGTFMTLEHPQVVDQPGRGQGLSPQATRIMELLRSPELPDRDRKLLVGVLKGMASGTYDIARQLKVKALEYRRSLVNSPARPSISLLDYEPCRRIPPMWEYMESQDYMGLTIVHPRIMDILVAVDDPTVRECYIQAGKGVGKSFLSAALLSRGAFILNSYPFVRQVFGTLPDDYIVVLNMSVSAAQAQKVIFQKLKSMITRATIFTGAHVGTREIEFHDKVVELCGHSGYEIFYGCDIFYGVLDEASHFDKTPDHDVAAEIHEGIVASQLTRFPNDYKLVAISSPKDEEDFLVSRVGNIKEKGRKVKIFTGDTSYDLREVSYESLGAWNGIAPGRNN
jgi:hypothetical protein